MSKGWKSVAAEKGSRVQRTNNDGIEGVPVRNPKSKIQNLKSSWAAAALSGILLVACFPKIHLRGLVWVACLPLLVVLASEKRLKRAFLPAYVCGAFFFAGSCYWFVIVMQFYGHLSRALSVVVLILFVIIDSTFFGGFGLAMGWAARRSAGWALALSPFLWVAMELARTYLITGFPWNLLGYAVQASGVRQIASVTGVYGLSFLAVATSALLAWVLMSARPRQNTILEIRKSKLESRPVPRGARESSPIAPSFEFRISSFSLRDLVSHTSLRPLAVLLGWLGLLLLAQWRLAPPPVVVGKELAFLVQPNVPLDEEELDAWVPWRDPTQLQQLVQFSVSAVDQFFPHDVAPGFSPAPGLAGLKPDGSSDTAAGLKPGATSRRESAGGAPGPTCSIQNSKSQIQNSTGSPIPNPKSKIQNRAPHAPLLIWAENPAPFYLTRDPVFRNAMENMARQTHAFVIGNTIIPLDAKGEMITNSAFTLDPDGREVSRYDKIHLVPFGEYVPGWALPGLVHKITAEVGTFVPGSSYAVAKSPGGGIGVFICYEAIIPQLARQLVANGADVLVNISNDAWYGNSAAAYQHLEMARLRTIENHRYLLRATNNGLTTLIDPHGRVLEQIPRCERAVMPAHFDFETRQTIYSVHGDVFAWLCTAVAGLMLLAASFARVEDDGRKAKGKM